MDTFIKAIRARGHKLEIKNDITYVIILDQSIAISLREKTNRKVVKGKYYDSTEKVPNGLLSFHIGEGYHKFEIVEGQELLENKLSKILARLEMKAKMEQEEQIRREKYWAEEREKERVRQEYQKLKAKELADFKSLFPKANRWNQCMILRRYLDELEDRSRKRNVLSDDLKEWLIWARKKIDWFDPFIEAEDPLLKGVDKDKLLERKEEKTSVWGSYFGNELY